MERKDYLRLLGIPDYIRGEVDLSALLPPPAAPSAPRRSPTPAHGQRASGAAPEARRRPKAPEYSPSQVRDEPVPRAAPRPRPKIDAPTSPESRYRPDLASIAKKGALIEEEMRSQDKPFTSEQSQQWTALQEEVSQCQLCPLHTGRSHTVFGDGAQTPRVLLVGEGPGADEDYAGLPFVGRSGRLLTSMIDAMGFARDQVYICNVVKCRPPNNRKPEPAEVLACSGYLDRQLTLLRPQVVLALGGVAAHRLLNSDLPVGKLRGRQHSYKLGELVFPVFVSYHPSYLLRKGSEKEQAWKDLKEVIRFLTGH